MLVLLIKVGGAPGVMIQHCFPKGRGHDGTIREAKVDAL